MFICLISLLGLGWDPGSQSFKSSGSISPEVQLSGLVALLGVVSSDNIYNMAVDASLDNRHLGYLKAVAQWLFQLDIRYIFYMRSDFGLP